VTGADEGQPWYLPGLERYDDGSVEQPVRDALASRHQQVVSMYLDTYPERLQVYKETVVDLYRMAAVADTETLSHVIDGSAQFDPGVIDETVNEQWVAANIDAGHTAEELARRDAARYMGAEDLRELMNAYTVREPARIMDVAAAAADELPVVDELISVAEEASIGEAVTPSTVHAAERDVYSDVYGYVQTHSSLGDLEGIDVGALAEPIASMDWRAEDRPEDVELLLEGLADARRELFAPLRQYWATELFNGGGL